MLMKIATVDILIEKAGFEPRVAVAVAEAMDEAMEGKIHTLQPVTVPILDARFAALDARFADLKSDILRQMYSALLGQLALVITATYFIALHVK